MIFVNYENNLHVVIDTEERFYMLKRVHHAISTAGMIYFIKSDTSEIEVNMNGITSISDEHDTEEVERQLLANK